MVRCLKRGDRDRGGSTRPLLGVDALFDHGGCGVGVRMAVESGREALARRVVGDRALIPAAGAGSPSPRSQRPAGGEPARRDLRRARAASAHRPVASHSSYLRRLRPAIGQESSTERAVSSHASAQSSLRQESSARLPLVLLNALADLSGGLDAGPRRRDTRRRHARSSTMRCRAAPWSSTTFMFSLAGSRGHVDEARRFAAEPASDGARNDASIRRDSVGRSATSSWRPGIPQLPWSHSRACRRRSTNSAWASQLAPDPAGHRRSPDAIAGPSRRCGGDPRRSSSRRRQPRAPLGYPGSSTVSRPVAARARALRRGGGGRR